MKHFLDIIFFIPVFKERKIENYDDIEKHTQDGLKIVIGFEIWVIIIMLTVGLITR